MAPPDWEGLARAFIVGALLCVALRYSRPGRKLWDYLMKDEES